MTLYEVPRPVVDLREFHSVRSDLHPPPTMLDERHGEPLPMRVLCSWCEAVLVEGDGDDENASHTICPPCLAKYFGDAA